MKIKTQISQKEYQKLLFGLTYRKPIMKTIICLACLIGTWIVASYLHIIKVPKPEIYQYLTLILIVIIQPITIFLTIKRNYISSNQLKEKLEIEAAKDEIKIQGDSFYMEMRWDKVFKINEERTCFLIYQNNLSAIIIPKNDLNSTQLKEFKTILSAIRNVPVNIKNS